MKGVATMNNVKEHVGLINKIIPFSNVDGVGNRTAIFLQGCNFNCLYCHNPETIHRCVNCGECVPKCPVQALSIEDGVVKYDVDKCVDCDTCIKTCRKNSSPKIQKLTAKELVEKIDKYKYFISGITVSGGECTLQSEFLTELFTEVKKLGLTTFIDTNGSTPICDNKELLEVTDKTMIDLKAYDRDEHKMLVGLDNDMVIRNIRELASMDKVYEIRTVVVPGVLDNEKTVDEGSKLLASINPDIRYKIIKFRPNGVRKGILDTTVPTNEYMKKLEDIAASNGCRNIIIV